LCEPAKHSNRLTNCTVGSSNEIFSIIGDGYDPHGNMQKMPQLEIMEWDYKDQLQMTQRQKVDNTDREGEEHKGERTYYIYDAAGQRVRKVTETSAGVLKDERIYLNGFEIYRAHTGNDAGLERETLHIMDDKQRIALVETQTQEHGREIRDPESLLRYQFGNHLGSVSLELGDQSQIISYEEYAPYGSTTYQAVNQSIKAAAKRYRYTGKERDEESGFSYNGTRYYMPWLGRWISCDPLFLVDGTNVYRFVQANPERFVDLSGMQSIDRNSDASVSSVPAAVPPSTDASSPSPSPGPPPTPGSNWDVLEYKDKDVVHRSVSLKNPKDYFVAYGQSNEAKAGQTEQCYYPARNTIQLLTSDKLIEGKHLIDPAHPDTSASVFPPRLTLYSAYRKEGNNMFLTQTSGRTADALSYVRSTLDRGRPLMAGVNEGDKIATDSSGNEINKGVTNHYIVITGYDAVFEKGEWRVVSLTGIDNATADVSKLQSFPRFTVNANGSITKSGALQGRYAFDLAYSITEIRVYKMDFDTVKTNSAWFGPNDKLVFAR